MNYSNKSANKFHGRRIFSFIQFIYSLTVLNNYPETALYLCLTQQYREMLVLIGPLTSYREGGGVRDEDMFVRKEGDLRTNVQPDHEKKRKAK